MVLPLRLTLAVLLLACACERPTAPTAEPEPELAPVEVEPDADTQAKIEGRTARNAPEQVERDGVVLGLWPDECLLLAESADARLVHTFEFPGACHFVVDADGKTRVVMTDTGPAWMIESSKPIVFAAGPGRAIAQDCDTALRVVVLTSAGARVSKAEQRVAMCAPFDWDEMMFHVLASEPVAFGTPGASP